jgi:hypothetical protein
MKVLGSNLHDDLEQRYNNNNPRCAWNDWLVGVFSQVISTPKKECSFCDLQPTCLCSQHFLKQVGERLQNWKRFQNCKLWMMSVYNEMSRDIVLTSRQKIVAWTWQCYGRCFILHMSISRIEGIELLQKKIYHEPIWKLGQIKNVGLCHVPYMYPSYMYICTYDKNVHTIQPLAIEKPR